MQVSNEQAIDVLNSLIETTLDSAHGYRDAAEATENMEYRTMFEARAAQRMQLAGRLQQEVRSFGGEPKDEQSLVGKAHNKFTELKGKIMGSSDKGVIDEVERGEDFIKAKFEKAAREEALPLTAKSVVGAAYTEIKADHDTISALKHRLH